MQKKKQIPIELQHTVSSFQIKREKGEITQTTLHFENTVTISEACIHTHTDKQINDNFGYFTLFEMHTFLFWQSDRMVSHFRYERLLLYSCVCEEFCESMKCFVYSFSLSN